MALACRKAEGKTLQGLPQYTRYLKIQKQTNQMKGHVEMVAVGAAPARAPRADALRNREAILRAARAVFESEGVLASLDGVAMRAGVGNATLYRNFPTRADLLAAAMEADLAEACAKAGRRVPVLFTAAPPLMSRLVDEVPLEFDMPAVPDAPVLPRSPERAAFAAPLLDKSEPDDAALLPEVPLLPLLPLLCIVPDCVVSFCCAALILPPRRRCSCSSTSCTRTRSSTPTTATRTSRRTSRSCSPLSYFG